MRWPLEHHRAVSSGFYDGRSWGLHAATDFPCPVGTPVYAAHKGTVVTRAWLGNGGYSVELDGDYEGKAIRTRYMHLSGFVVQQGDVVGPGRLIAWSGNTGSASLGPHLHFAVWFFRYLEALEVQGDPYATQAMWAVDPMLLLGRSETGAEMDATERAMLQQAAVDAAAARAAAEKISGWYFDGAQFTDPLADKRKDWRPPNRAHWQDALFGSMDIAGHFGGVQTKLTSLQRAIAGKVDQLVGAFKELADGMRGR